MTERKMFQYDSEKHSPALAFLNTPELKAKHGERIARIEKNIKECQAMLDEMRLAEQTAAVMKEADASGYTTMSVESFIFAMEIGEDPDIEGEDK